MMAVRFLCAWPPRSLVMDRGHGVEIPLFDPKGPRQLEALRDTLSEMLRDRIEWADIAVGAIETQPGSEDVTVRVLYVPRGTPRAPGQQQPRVLDVVL